MKFGRASTTWRILIGTNIEFQGMALMELSLFVVSFEHQQLLLRSLRSRMAVKTLGNSKQTLDTVTCNAQMGG